MKIQNSPPSPVVITVVCTLSSPRSFLSTTFKFDFYFHNLLSEKDTLNYVVLECLIKLAPWFVSGVFLVN